MRREVNLLIGGEAGQGLVTIGQILTKCLVRTGYHVVVSQDYMSRIRGGHNTYAIRVGVDSPGESKEWIKEAWYEYPLTDAGGRYVWEVAICRGDPSTHICEQLAVSEQQSFSFTCSPTKPTPTRRLRQ